MKIEEIRIRDRTRMRGLWKLLVSVRQNQLLQWKGQYSCPGLSCGGLSTVSNYL